MNTSIRFEEIEGGSGSEGEQTRRDVASAAQEDASENRDATFQADAGEADSEDELLLPHGDPVASSGRTAVHELIQFPDENAFYFAQRDWIQNAFQQVSTELGAGLIHTSDVKVALDTMTNVFARHTAGAFLRGMEAKLVLKQDMVEKLDFYMAKHPNKNRALLTLLKNRKEIAVVVVGSVILEPRFPYNTLKVVSRSSFLDVVKERWRSGQSSFFETPDAACDSVKTEDILDLPLFKANFERYFDNEKPVGVYTYDLTKRICDLSLTGGFWMHQWEKPQVLRSDPGAPQSVAKVRVIRNRKGGRSEFDKFRQRALDAVRRAKTGQTKRGGQSMEPGKHKKRRKTGQQPGKPAAEGPLQKQAGPGKGGGTPKKCNETIMDLVRQRLPSPNCLTQLLTRDVMLCLLLSPAIAAGQIGADEPPPSTPSEVEKRVFSHCVQRRIRELHCGEALSDMTDEAERMRQELTAALPAPGPGASDSPDEGRYWTATYFLHHASFFDSPHLKAVCSNAHSLMAQLLGRIAVASKEQGKPQLEAEALVDKVLQVIAPEADEGAGEPQTPKAPFASEAHIAIAHAINLQTKWNSKRESAPPKDLLHQFLRLKGDVTTVNFVTAALMLRVHRARTPELKRKELLKSARYFLSEECELYELELPGTSFDVQSWIMP